MVPPIQEPCVNFRSARKSRFVFSAVVVAAAGLALAGCGRKGPLDAPPGAAIASPEPASTSSDTQERSLLGDPSQPNSVSSLPAAKGAKKRIPLDVLLD
jgi:predicted small lipoprotein YifL